MIFKNTNNIDMAGVDDDNISFLLSYTTISNVFHVCLDNSLQSKRNYFMYNLCNL